MSNYAQNQPICFINGKRHILPDDSTGLTLLQYLRSNGYTGTKLGCGQGGCGSCTVMISFFINDKIKNFSVNACLYPLYAADNAHIITIEGIGNSKKGLHPIQESISKHHGSQCGFCTPGFVMSMYSLLRNSNGHISEMDIEECISGNLCRCTGYRPILDAFKDFASYHNNNENDKEKLCPSTGLPCDCSNTNGQSHQNINGENGFDKDLIFPPELKRRTLTYLEIKGKCNWHRPVKLDQLLELKSRYPDAQIVVGNTKVGIESKFRKEAFPILIYPKHIPELTQIEIGDNCVIFGAAVTMSLIRDFCKTLNSEDYKLESLNALNRQLRWFAGTQIRNVASLGGNIALGTATSDVNPLLVASGATFVVAEKNKENINIKASEFFIGHKKIKLKKSEVLIKIEIPYTEKLEYVCEFKQSKRREHDIAIVNAGMRIKFNFDTNLNKLYVKDASIAYGNVAPTTIEAKNVEKCLIDKEWNINTIKDAMLTLKEDVDVLVDAPGGMSEYRNSLSKSFLFKFLLIVSKKVSKDLKLAYKENIITPDLESAITKFDRPIPKGVQFHPMPDKQLKLVGHIEKHKSADLHVTGEAIYTYDIKVSSECLHAAVVLSTVAHGNILGIDTSEALALEGVHGYFSHEDIPGSNVSGFFQDEEIFVSSKVTCVGQVIGIIVADTQEIAKQAVKKIQIVYDSLPTIITIEEAIEKKSFYGNIIKKECGDVDAEMDKCDHVIEGSGKCGGQEHFYLETQNCVVIPIEEDEYLVYSSTQGLKIEQDYISKTLGIPLNKVVVKTKRIGGGFGGKSTRTYALSCAASVAAYHLRKPIRLCYDREIDMQATGQRHPFISNYKVGFSKEGRIQAMDLKLYSNAGCSVDSSYGVMQKAMSQSESCYKIDNIRVQGYSCKTNLPSNTAFRGIGAPQAALLTEMCIAKIAHYLKIPTEKIIEINMIKEGECKFYGQKMENCRLNTCWDEVLSQSDFINRKKEIEEFNKKSKFIKRGISIIPSMFGIAFLAPTLEQAGALVHVYTDGTVLISHGGIEMGQGLHTKLCQIAAEAFNISFESVYISETSTDKVPNSVPTSGSLSTDLYGAAVMDACNQINKRLEPIKKEFPNLAFSDICKKAYFTSVDLSAHGFFVTPDITGFDGNRPFNYYTFGAACTEIELDTLTGDFHIIRSDIVMDIGNPINPAIDIGQIEGAFVQGLGWLTTEEVIYGDNKSKWMSPGVLYSSGPGYYKIPTANDIPIDFRIKILSDVPNQRAIHSSKAVGEPPLILCNTAFFALKNAIYAIRKENGNDSWFDLEAPCTPERLKLACGMLTENDMINFLEK